MSYLERTLWWFLKERVFGGIKKLKNKYFFPFAIIVAIFAMISTTITVLYQLGLFFTLENVQQILILQLFLSLGLLISGLLIGKIKNIIIYYSLVFGILSLMAVVYFFFEWSYYQPFFQYTKLSFFILWVLITCISFFFLLLYFFTSFPKKVMMLGAPEGHIFFSPIIKAISLISIPVYFYMMFQFSIASIIIGVFGIFTAIIIFILISITPNHAGEHPSLPNFVGALGFFHLFLFYHLIASFSFTAFSLSSLIIDILLLFITILYIIQSLTRRIAESPEQVKPYENPIRFQTRLYITDRLKKTFGEPGLVLIVMGLALGYQMVYLDSFFITEFPILSEFFTPDLRLSALYHRVYLIVSFTIIIIALIIYNNSLKFQELMVDKYTISQVFKYISHYFKRNEDGVSPIEYGAQILGQKVGKGIKKIGNKWVSTIQDKLPLGDKEKEDEGNQLPEEKKTEDH